MSLSQASDTPDGTDARPESVADSTVKPTFTPKRRSKRPRRDVETMDYLGAARRFIRAAGNRVADADEFELAELLALQTDLADAIAVAVRGQKTRKSWAAIALATGTTREAAYQKWGKS